MVGLVKDGVSINEMGPVQTSHPSGDPVLTIRVPISGCTAYEKGGTITQKKMPKQISFRWVFAPESIFGTR